MVARRAEDSDNVVPLRPPAKTPEAREQQLIALAIDLAEKQLSEGTASSQVQTHFLKLATERESLEREKLRRENELLTARVEQLASASRIEELIGAAMDAMKSYSGGEDDGFENYEDVYIPE